MTSQLIPVFAGEISATPVQLVDGRLLHGFLESAQQFANWIVSRIEDYGFIEGQDFLINLLKTKGRPSKEYSLTIDMAKELGMIERNEKGRQIRRYFIDMERRALQLPTTPEPLTKLACAGGLFLEDQDIVKTTVKQRVEALPKEKWASASRKIWSSIKAKYGCSYKEVPSDQLAAILSLIARMDFDDEVLEIPKKQLEAFIDDRIKALPAPVSSNAIIINLTQGDQVKTLVLNFDTDSKTYQRWAVSQDNGSVFIKTMPDDSQMMSFEQWIKYATQERGYIVMKQHDLINRLKSTLEA